MALDLDSFPPAGLAVVVGASGGIGKALHQSLEQSGRFDQVLAFSRSTHGFDLTREDTIAQAASNTASVGLPVRLVIVATGLLHEGDMQPEKTWRHLDANNLARSFAINATGPALVAKHFLPLMPRDGKAVFAALSAKVGSIGDNHLGGW